MGIPDPIPRAPVKPPGAAARNTNRNPTEKKVKKKTAATGAFKFAQAQKNDITASQHTDALLKQDSPGLRLVTSIVP